MPLPRLELETSGFDTMLGFMHQPDEPKSLSSWEEVGNPLIFHNIHMEMQIGLTTESHKREIQQSAHNFVWFMKDGNKNPIVLFTQSKNAMETTNMIKMKNQYFIANKSRTAAFQECMLQSPI